MKILHVVNIDFAIPYFFGRQFEFMKEHGVQVSVACSSSNVLDSYAMKYGFTPYHIEIYRGINPLKDVRSILQLWRIIYREKFDIVLGHTPKGALIGMIASFLAMTTKRVYVRHGLMLETSKGFIWYILFLIERITAAFSTHVLCVSRSVMQRAELLNLGGNSKSFVLNHMSANGIDTKRFSRDNFSAEFISSFKGGLQIVVNKRIIGFVGRISNDKGIPDLIRAWNSILLDMPDVHLLLLGVFDDRDQVSQDIIEYIAKIPSVTHIDFQSDVAPYYAIMDILILPSYREGLPTVVLEASSMELPIIITEATGCVDAIIDNETGIFTDHTPIGILNAIKFYITNPQIRKQHGKNGRDFILANFKQEYVWGDLLLFFVR